MTVAEGETPEGWAWSTVGEVADVQLGRQRSPQNHTGDQMRPYLRSANIGWAGLKLDDVNEMNFDDKDFETYQLLPGDLLLNEASGSPNEVGKPAIWQGEIDGCCFQNTLIRVKPRGLGTSYLYWYFYNAALSGRFGEAGRGVNIRHLGKQGLARFPVPSPPLAEQERIVTAVEEQISRLNAAENSLRMALHRLVGLERAILQQADDPSWPEVELGDLLIGIEAGKSFRTPGRSATPDEWGVIKVSAMTWGAFNEEENKAVLDVDRVHSRFEIKAGDLLFSRANTSELVGAAVLVGRTRSRLLLSDKSMRLLPQPDVSAKWLRYCLGAPSIRRQISSVASGTSNSMRNISQAKVRRLRLHVPPNDDQSRIAGEIASQRTTRQRLEQELAGVTQRSRALRRSILAAAFSGRLVPQDPNDEPASVLLERIAAERAAAQPTPKTRRKKASA